MPTIDVTGVLYSLGIANQTFSVLRRTETVNSFGESVVANESIGPLTGAVQPGASDLVTEEAYRANKSAITVWTTFRLFDISRKVDQTTYQPDLILWQDNYYLIRSLNNWSEFGAGYMQAECIGFEFVQTPVTT